DRFSEAAGDRPDSAARREDVGRCFETWGWRTLAQGRPEEAALLFGQGLAAVPDDPALLKAAGVAAVHAGRVDDALGPLEAAARLRADAQVRMLLARLYDHRDEPERAVAHLRALLAVDPVHDEARRLLDKLEREQRTEAAGRAPRWLQEGLAQVLEGRAADPALAASGGLTLSGLEALVTDPDPRRAHAGYELALFVVADLLDRGGMESMRALLARLGAGETIADA